ncbi:helix-turn-helix domain-containing protein [Haloprofundus halobius]|uniref:helix-turn-helix domain-containing protein n=1 Tax=Haloprofundus halobius TaxID=2876194 RepID=UPI001CCE2D34|nr:helix-turn-helix domain-containing protein [Haloprofundus halobius]
MSYIAEFELSGPTIPLIEALARVPSMKLRTEEAVSSGGSSILQLYVWASGDDFERFEAGLDVDETVVDYEVVDSFETKRLYRVRVPSDADVLYPAIVEVGASRLKLTTTYEGLDVRMRFPDRDSLSTFRQRVREAGISFSLKRLYAPESPELTKQYGLSEKQRTALLTAVDIGYYDVPRRANLDELAEKLDISGQAASERLRRGTVALVRNTIDAES